MWNTSDIWGGLRPRINPSPAPLVCSHSFQLPPLLFARLDIKQQDCSRQEVQGNATFQQPSEPRRKWFNILRHPGQVGLFWSKGQVLSLLCVVTIRAGSRAPPGKAFTTAAARCSAPLSWERQETEPATALGGESISAMAGSQLPHLLPRFSVCS